MSLVCRAIVQCPHVEGRPVVQRFFLFYPAFFVLNISIVALINCLVLAIQMLSLTG